MPGIGGFMKKTEMHLRTDEEKRAYIERCEQDFLERLQATLHQFATELPHIVLLSGPSCSCKTTIAHHLQQTVQALHKRMAVISIDDFFLDREALDRKNLDGNTQLDYDSASALDLSYFQTCAEALCRGEVCRIPKYDFHKGVRRGYETLDPTQYDTLVFEGIQAIYPQVTTLFQNVPHRSVTLGVKGELDAGGVIFTGNEIRLYRRIVRDERFRSAPAAFTMFLWQSVRTNEEKNILPYQHTADVFLDSLLPYEPLLLKEPLCHALQTVPQDSPFYRQAQAMIKKMQPLPAISPALLPENSVYHEFL